MPYLYLLYEHAAGYALFKSVKFTEMKSLKKTLSPNVTELETFQDMIKFLEMKLFKDTVEAYEAFISIYEGKLHPDLKTFVEQLVPLKTKSIIGVADPVLVSAISEMGYNCSAGKTVRMILRGIKLHFLDLVKNLDISVTLKSQSDLSFHYSRIKAKYNMQDYAIRQNVIKLGQLDDKISNISWQLCDIYNKYFPELLNIVHDDLKFIQCVDIINKCTGLEELKEKLLDVLKNPKKCKRIVGFLHVSIGVDKVLGKSNHRFVMNGNVSPKDLENINNMINSAFSMVKEREVVKDFIKSNMQEMAPNLSALLGEIAGAKLINQAGRLENIALSAASSLQMLGVDKQVIDDYMDNGGGIPTFGSLYNSEISSNSPDEVKRQFSRYLANKCVVAARIDFFKETPTEVFGEKLKNQVVSRLDYLETGEKQLNNKNVMSEALSEDKIQQREIKKAQKRALKREKKRKLQEMLFNRTSDGGTSDLISGAEVEISQINIKKEPLSPERTTINEEPISPVQTIIQEKNQLPIEITIIDEPLPPLAKKIKVEGLSPKKKHQKNKTP